MLTKLASDHKDSKTNIPPPTPDTTLTLCYTSGTTGNPKGAMISHGNLISEMVSLNAIGVDINSNTVHLSYLPMAHSMERVVSAAIYFKGGSLGFFNGDVFRLKEDLAELRPTIFVSVPRLFNRFYDAMKAKIEDMTGIKRRLVDRAISAKLAKLERTGDPTHGLWDCLVCKKFKAVLGGRVEFMVTGSAPISKDIMSFLKVAFSCPIYEGYG